MYIKLPNHKHFQAYRCGYIEGYWHSGGRPHSEIIQTVQFLASSTDALSNCIYTVGIYMLNKYKIFYPGNQGWKVEVFPWWCHERAQKSNGW